MQPPSPMHLVRRPDGWWITNVPDSEDCGPYDTRAEAESDRVGMWRSILTVDVPGVWVTA